VGQRCGFGLSTGFRLHRVLDPGLLTGQAAQEIGSEAGLLAGQPTPSEAVYNERPRNNPLNNRLACL
jgi:hypothetical protein